MWRQWEQAYRWDRKNPISIHKKLTHTHIYLDSSAKMRNHLAEDVLNTEMLQLMLEFKESLGNDGDSLDGAIELLRNTSQIVSVFSDSRPITDISDTRIHQTEQVLNWFRQWQEDAVTDKNVPAAKRKLALMSDETREDIYSGFLQLCRYRFQSNAVFSLNPSRINSDVIENQFCQQRGIFHGNQTNPTYKQFAAGTNSIILGQHSVSKKGNSSASTRCTAANPYNFHTSKPLCKRIKKSHETPAAQARGPLQDLTLDQHLNISKEQDSHVASTACITNALPDCPVAEMIQMSKNNISNATDNTTVSLKSRQTLRIGLSRMQTVKSLHPHR